MMLPGLCLWSVLTVCHCDLSEAEDDRSVTLCVRRSSCGRQLTLGGTPLLSRQYDHHIRSSVSLIAAPLTLAPILEQ